MKKHSKDKTDRRKLCHNLHRYYVTDNPVGNRSGYQLRGFGCCATGKHCSKQAICDFPNFVNKKFNFQSTSYISSTKNSLPDFYDEVMSLRYHYLSFISIVFILVNDK